MKNNRLLLVLFGTCVVAILAITFFIVTGKKNGEHLQQASTQQQQTETDAKNSLLTDDPEESELPTLKPTVKPTPTPTLTPTPKPTVKPTPKPTKKPQVGNGKVIVIDAGHQSHQNSALEPIGPGSSQKKPKVASGTSGVSTGVPEYKLTLQVSLKLQKALEAEGYHVIMVRTTNDVNISNSERAEVANKANADAFIRIHADGSENRSAQGAMTICPTSKNPYCAQIYQSSYRLSECIIKGMVQTTGCKSRGVWQTDTMSGINWCKVPVTILEMGFMSNPEEDTKMETDDYQNKMVQGMVVGFQNYFGK